MINLEELDVLKDKIIYNTNNNKYVLYEKNENIVNSVDYKLLGFLNGYSYSYMDGYLIKSTINQTEIARISLEVTKAVFIEGFSYFYVFDGNSISKVTENLIVEWYNSFDDDIRDITMDYYGDIYTLFKNSRIIRKYSKNGNYIYYLNESDDPSKNCRLYKTFVNKGGGHLYTIGSEFWDGKVRSFVDHYLTRKCKRIDTNTLCEYDNVEVDDPYFTYKDLYIDGDFLYIYANNYIEKLNIKLKPIWSYGFGYNYITETMDSLIEVTFDDNKFNNRIFFCENLNSSNGYSFGKLSTNGSLLWKIIVPNNSEIPEFNLCIYESDIFMITKHDVTAKSSYVLALDDNRVLFETRDGYLIRVVDTDYDAIYDPVNYIGEYLLGDEIKEGISKTKIYNLLHDTGEIVDEEDDNILLEEENPNYTDPENYNHYRLIGIEKTTVNDFTTLTTKDGKSILTFEDSYIETLFPYQPGAIIQDEDGNTIMINLFYILADRYKYLQDIVTKKKELVIITKKKGFSIIRKAKFVHKYVVRQLLDIDIIVEYLVQNGILNTFVPRYIERLKHHTTHMIEDMQKALKPQYFNIEPIKRYGYQYDGYDYPLRISNTQMFICKNIPYIGKADDHKIYIESMSTLVENEEITPFLLFLNGKAVKWSDVTIVRDWYFSYIIISNNADESENLEAVLFPCVIRYGEDNGILEDCTTGLYFDNEGYLTSDISKIAFRIEVLDKNVVGYNHIITKDKPYLEFTDIEYNQLTDENNILVFEDGRFFGDSRFYLESQGKNIYTYSRNTNNVVFKTYYFDKANDSKNMIFDVPVQEEVRQNIVDKVTNSELKPTDNFMVPFDFYLTRDKSYVRNISEATRYILLYHMQLLIDFYKDQSNIKSIIFTGDRLLSIASDGYLIMPRQKYHDLYDYIIVFKNDELYDVYHEMIYETSNFKIPITGHITASDKIEIIHFKKVDNRYYNLTVTIDEPDYISKDLRYDNFVLFGNSSSGSINYDTFNPDNNIQYELNFDYKNSFNEYGKYQNTEIKLEDSYYIGKEINIASKRQFHYLYYDVTQSQRVFNLTPEFRFCHNKNQYMVFLNGKKLNLIDWELDIMVDNHEINCITITTNQYLSNGDRISIFYLPDPYEEIILENHNSKFGDVILDVSQLDYPFDRELFLIFVDGKKIQTDRIQNISANRVRILSTQPEYHTVCICKYLNPDKLLQKVFSYGDIWTNSVDSLSESEYEKLFTKIGDVIKM